MPILTSNIRRHKITKNADNWSGRIKLIISGFSKQNYISVDQIITAIEILPNDHIGNLKMIKYDKRKRSLKYPYNHGLRSPVNNVAGIYDDLLKGVVIFPFKNTQDFYEVFYHEIGHYVYHHSLGQNKKCEWVTKINYNSPLISDYAGKNASESFAETYMFYILRNRELKLNEIKYHFFHDIVFKTFVPDIKKIIMKY